MDFWRASSARQSSLCYFGRLNRRAGPNSCSQTKPGFTAHHSGMGFLTCGEAPGIRKSIGGDLELVCSNADSHAPAAINKMIRDIQSMMPDWAVGLTCTSVSLFIRLYARFSGIHFSVCVKILCKIADNKVRFHHAFCIVYNKKSGLFQTIKIILTLKAIFAWLCKQTISCMAKARVAEPFPSKPS